VSGLTPAQWALLKLSNKHCEVLVVGMVALEDEWTAAEGVGLPADWYEVIVTTHEAGGDLIEVFEIESEIYSLSVAEALASEVAAQLLGDPSDYVVST